MVVHLFQKYAISIINPMDSPYQIDDYLKQYQFEEDKQCKIDIRCILMIDSCQHLIIMSILSVYVFQANIFRQLLGSHYHIIDIVEYLHYKQGSQNPHILCNYYFQLAQNHYCKYCNTYICHCILCNLLKCIVRKFHRYKCQNHPCIQNILKHFHHKLCKQILHTLHMSFHLLKNHNLLHIDHTLKHYCCKQHNISNHKLRKYRQLLLRIQFDTLNILRRFHCNSYRTLGSQSRFHCIIHITLCIMRSMWDLKGTQHNLSHSMNQEQIRRQQRALKCIQLY